jgi:hypothetical protein
MKIIERKMYVDNQGRVIIPVSYNPLTDIWNVRQLTPIGVFLAQISSYGLETQFKPYNAPFN